MAEPTKTDKITTLDSHGDAALSQLNPPKPENPPVPMAEPTKTDRVTTLDSHGDAALAQVNPPRAEDPPVGDAVPTKTDKITTLDSHGDAALAEKTKGIKLVQKKHKKHHKSKVNPPRAEDPPVGDAVPTKTDKITTIDSHGDAALAQTNPPKSEDPPVGDAVPTVTHKDPKSRGYKEVIDYSLSQKKLNPPRAEDPPVGDAVPTKTDKITTLDSHGDAALAQTNPPKSEDPPVSDAVPTVTHKDPKSRGYKEVIDYSLSQKKLNPPRAEDPPVGDAVPTKTDRVTTLDSHGDAALSQTNPPKSENRVGPDGVQIITHKDPKSKDYKNTIDYSLSQKKVNPPRPEDPPVGDAVPTKTDKITTLDSHGDAALAEKSPKKKHHKKSKKAKKTADKEKKDTSVKTEVKTAPDDKKSTFTS